MYDEKILIIDDEPIVCRAFKKELGDVGYDVDSALSGEEALRKIKTEKYDLVFVDLVLPGKDGIETCRAIKKVSPASKLIFMTGRLDVDPIFKEVDFVNAGGKTYNLYKPFIEGEILEITRKALSEK